MQKGDSKTSAQRVSLSARAAKRRKKKKRQTREGASRSSSKEASVTRRPLFSFSLSLVSRRCVLGPRTLCFFSCSLVVHAQVAALISWSQETGARSK